MPLIQTTRTGKEPNLQRSTRLVRNTLFAVEIISTRSGVWCIISRSTTATIVLAPASQLYTHEFWNTYFCVIKGTELYIFRQILFCSYSYIFPGSYSPMACSLWCQINKSDLKLYVSFVSLWVMAHKKRFDLDKVLWTSLIYSDVPPVITNVSFLRKRYHFSLNYNPVRDWLLDANSKLISRSLAYLAHDWDHILRQTGA